ncbi:MAG: sugar phosphate isomerase/epimerase family protein [Phycisphaeraceae bacterium]
MRTSFNLLLWTTHVTDEHIPLFDKLKAVGYDGVEIPIFEGDVKHFTKVGKAIKKAGLGCTSVTVATPDANPISSDKKVRSAAVDRLKWALDCSAALGSEILCGPYHQPLGEFSGDPPTKAEKSRAVEVHREAAKYAKSVGLKMAIEYLNRFECYFINTLADAAAHVKAVNHPSFGTMYDTFHANIEEKDGPGEFRKHHKSVFHVHISENDRGTPGAGHVPWFETFRALREVGYNNWICIEAFGRALPALAAATRVWRDFFKTREEVYTKGLAFMKSMWELAG